MEQLLLSGRLIDLILLLIAAEAVGIFLLHRLDSRRPAPVTCTQSRLGCGFDVHRKTGTTGGSLVRAGGLSGHLHSWPI